MDIHMHLAFIYSMFLHIFQAEPSVCGLQVVAFVHEGVLEIPGSGLEYPSIYDEKCTIQDWKSLIGT
jgi:hypothetical protein